ncbi:metal ABC transporter permease [Roseospira visakhapatnamensis]|uniref:High-affinity zinc uptake system membrane protein ZnuB n=1 Tax=Roseospira visakhapatnamensis TaxID=390880 RepID=A0A7W6RB28_9PROT|nr:metal ABC transporter permease [Roseospira visakhapatnamensis]MBB4264856.1 zinc transport system permease protein [Roseospira visakhapatnamensis]
MLDDFFSRALIAGVGLALITGPLGCFVVWRRMAYFGATMAHSALLGAALALFLRIEPMSGVFLVATLVAGALMLLERIGGLSSDTLLGILAHAALAIGLVAVAAMPWVRVDLMGFLFGDILAVSRTDIAIIFASGVVILGLLAWSWRSLLAATVNEELARAEGLGPTRARVLFMLLLATVIAIAMKLVGILLITALLIIPAATARRLAGGPEAMAVVASLVGAVAVVLGLGGSLTLDTPSGPSIVMAAFLLFLASLLPMAWRRGSAPPDAGS